MTYTASVLYTLPDDQFDQIDVYGLDEPHIDTGLNDDIYFIGNFAVSKANFISVEFTEDPKSPDTVNVLDSDTERIREIAESVSRMLAEDAKKATTIAAVTNPSSINIGGVTNVTTLDPIQPWNTRDTFEAPRPVWSSIQVDEVSDPEVKTSLEQAIEGQKRASLSTGAIYYGRS